MAKQSNLEIFLSGFSRVFDEQWQVDILLKAGDTTNGEAISAHKLVLAARSEMFKKMLESDEFKASNGKIEVVSFYKLKHEELEALVEFVYNNDSLLSEKGKKHVRSLYIAADKYEIPHLRDLCRNELISSLDFSNALDVFELSVVPLDKSLMSSAAKFILRNMRTICHSVEFKLFVLKYPALAVELMKAYFTYTYPNKK